MLPAPRVAAPGLADVEVAEALAAVDQRRFEIGLLDVHVVGVEVQLDVGQADSFGERGGLRRGVQHVALVAVDDLQPDRDVVPRRALADPAQHLDRAGDAGCRRRLRVLLERRVQDAADVRGVNLACHVQHLHQARFAARLLVGVAARDVGRGIEAERQRRAQAITIEHPAREGRVDRRRVERRYLDQVEAEFRGLCDGTFAFVVAPAADPDERMDAELVHDGSPLIDDSRGDGRRGACPGRDRGSHGRAGRRPAAASCPARHDARA